MNKTLIQTVVLIAVLVIAGIVIKYIVINKFIGETKQQISKIVQLEKLNKDQKTMYEDSLSTIWSFTTTKIKNLEKEVDNLTDNYQAFIDSSKGTLSAVHTGKGEVSISDTVPISDIEDWPDTLKITTPWAEFFYNRKLEIASIKLNFLVKLEGIETSDPYGNRQAIERVFLESILTGETRPVKWEANFTFFKQSKKLWHWWNPKIHSGILLTKPVQYCLSANLMSFGLDKYIETTAFYFLDIGVASDFQDKITITGIPILLNMGNFLPFISNVNIGPGLGFEVNSQKPVFIIKMDVTF